MQLKISSFILILFVLALAKGQAQQYSVFTHHPQTYAYTNPGFAGISEAICLNGLMRQQWVGFKDEEGNNVAPETFLISIDSPISLLRGGLGGAIVQDKIGFESNIGLQFGYAYHLETASGTLGMGLGVNFMNRSTDFSKFILTQPNDPILPASEESDMLFDMSAGLFWHVPEFYYLGFSVTNILETKGQSLTASAEGASFVGDRTFHIMAGYQYMLPNNTNYEIQPAFNLMTNFSSTQINLSTVLVYNNRFWGGVNYRLQESVGVMVGVHWNDFKIGYAYDINTLGLNVPGTHELSLGYCFKITPDRSTRSYRNTRFL